MKEKNCTKAQKYQTGSHQLHGEEILQVLHSITSTASCKTSINSSKITQYYSHLLHQAITMSSVTTDCHMKPTHLTLYKNLQLLMKRNSTAAEDVAFPAQ